MLPPHAASSRSPERQRRRRTFPPSTSFPKMPPKFSRSSCASTRCTRRRRRRQRSASSRWISPAPPDSKPQNSSRFPESRSFGPHGPTSRRSFKSAEPWRRMEFSLCLRRVIDRLDIARKVREGRGQPVPLAGAPGITPARIASEHSELFAHRVNAQQTIARNRQAKIISSASDPARSQRCRIQKLSRPSYSDGSTRSAHRAGP